MLGDHGGHVAERLLAVRVVEDDGQDGGEDDAEEDGALPLTGHHDDGHQHAEGRDGDRHGGQIAQRHRGARAGDHDATVDEADEEDEEADADDDGLLELQRHGVEDGFAEAGQHQDGDDDALHEDDAHGALHRQALGGDQLEGHDGVDAQPGSEGVGTVADQAHEQRHDAGDQAGDGEGRREVQAQRLQALDAGESEDVRVHEDDV